MFLLHSQRFYDRIHPMKQETHPPYFPKAHIQCTCGNVIETGSTKETMEVEACSACHPFFTGSEQNLEKVGQVQKFKQRLAAKQGTGKVAAKKINGSR